MEDLCTLTSWKRSTLPHPLYVWALIDIKGSQVVKFFLFYKEVKFYNITREETGPTIVNEWIQKKRKELSSVKGQFFITRHKQENSRQIRQFLDRVGKDFHVTYVDDLATHGVPWGNTLLETLVDLGSTTEYRDIFTKMQ